jgi:HlyD family secretion protein
MRKWTLLSLVGILLLVACGGNQTPQADPAEDAAPEPDLPTKVVADGVLEPVRWSDLRFEAAGIVAEVLVEAGEVVDAGDVLMRQDGTELELAVREAEAALGAAHAELAVLLVRPRAEEIAAAEAELEEMEAALAQAVAQSEQVTGGAADAAIAEARAEVTAAEAEWLVARDDRDDLYRRTEDDDEDDREAREQADYRFHAAREALAAAQTKLEVETNTTWTRIREAEAKVEAAMAERDVATANLDLLQKGPAAWEIAAAEARVDDAEVVLKEAQTVLGRAVLRAPFSGMVTKVNVEAGSTIDPGDVVAVLATTDRLEVRTVDLTELDVARVRAGQDVMVTADALPETRLSGRVRRIGLRFEDYRGDVTYPVMVELDEHTPQLRWGMTVVAEFEVD